MLPFARAMSFPSIGRVARTISIRKDFRGAAQLSAVAALRLPGSALPCCRLAAWMRQVVVIEVDGAAAHRLVVGHAVVALVHAARFHQVGLGLPRPLLVLLVIHLVLVGHLVLLAPTH